MWYRLSSSRLAHLVSSMLGIPSSLGDLYGLSLWSCLLNWPLVMVSASQHGLMSGSSPYVVAGRGGLGRKKQLASTLPFSSFVATFLSMPLFLCVSIGILDLPPSVACEEVSLCTVHMSRSSALSSQSLQCRCFVFSSVLRYRFTASVCSACFM